MIVCKHTNKIFIVFEYEIIMLINNGKDYPYNNSFQLKYNMLISDAKLSFDEKMLAVALHANKEQNAKIEIYSMESEENVFKLICGIDNLNKNVEYIDFSTDNYFLLYKDEADDVAIIDIQT